MEFCFNVLRAYYEHFPFKIEIHLTSPSRHFHERNIKELINQALLAKTDPKNKPEALCRLYHKIQELPEDKFFVMKTIVAVKTLDWLSVFQ